MKRIEMRENFIRLPVILMIGALILTLIPSLLLPKTTQAASTASSTPGKTRILELYGTLPLRFELNQGQTDSQVRYLSRNSGYDLFLTPGEAVMVLHKQQKKQSTGGTVSRQAQTDKADVQTRNVVRMRLSGANAKPTIRGRNILPGKSHYFIGNDRKHWHTNIPQYAQVAYEGLYPGIDLAFYGTNRQLEYDFIVKPGADPNKIMIAFSGMDTIALEKNGDLILQTGSDTIVHRAPRIYQEMNGEKRSITGNYVLYDGNRAGFHVAAYDTKRPLVIDPELTYSTYIGGINLDNCNGIAIDSSGHAYITGGTDSPNFPINNPQVKNSGRDVFITKLDSDGSTLEYTTYLGGSNNEEAFGIALDQTYNHVYITGSTDSDLDFPLTTPIQNLYGGGLKDAFITKLNINGSPIVYSTYHGGNLEDIGLGIAVDIAGRAYVTGYTFSTNFPTQDPYQTHMNGSNAFVTKVNATGTSPFIYSTYLGGGNQDYGQSIAVDASGNAYVTGRTTSDDFPKKGTLVQPARAGGNDAFVTKVNANGTDFTYSTYLGGTNDDYGQSIAVDSSGNAYVTGYTTSSDFPTKNQYQSYVTGSGTNVFMTKVNTTSSSPLVYSTYLGGSGTDEGHGIAVDSNNYAYVTGTTSSSTPSAFPTTVNAVQTKNGGGYDAFIAKFNTSASGSSLLYSTYLGGTTHDYGQSIAVDSSENVYVTGYTYSDDFPMAGTPYETLWRGGRDAFVTKSTTTDPPTPPPSPPDSGGGCFIDTVFRR